MNKKRKILIPFLALCSSAFMAFGVVGATAAPAKVDAEATPYNVLKIEDAITSIDDVKWRRDGKAVFTLSPDSESKYYAATVTGITDDSRVYTSHKDDAGIDVESYVYSKNDYEGNLTFYSTATNFHHVYVEGNTSNDLLSFNTLYEPSGTDSAGAARNTYLNLYFRRPSNLSNTDSKAGGYRITWIENSSSSAVTVYTAQNSAWETVNTETRDKIKWSTIIAAYNEKNGTEFTDKTDLAEARDALNITYGAYTENDKTYITFKVDNLSKGLDNIIDYTVEDTVSATVPTGKGFSIATHQSNRRPLIEYIGRTMMIGGVDRPILAETKETTVTGDYKEGASVASVELPEGYALKSTEGTLVAGENVLAATYTEGTYYNKPCVYEAKVTVNATAVKKVTMTIEDKAGNELSSAEVNEGETFTLAATATAGKLIGFKEGANFYPVGKEITATQDTTFTAVCVEFDTLDGAAVRMKNDEKGYAGLRFDAAIAKADLDAYGSLFAIKAIVVPTDLIEGDFDYNEANATPFTFTEENYVENGANIELSFGYTSLKYGNYNRKFSALTYLEVCYTDGSANAYICADYDEENNSRSIYDVACTLYETKKDSYSAQNLAYLESYIAYTVDLTVGETSAEVKTVAGVEKAFTLTTTETTITIVYDELPAGCTESTTSIVLPINAWDGETYSVSNLTATFDASTKTATISAPAEQEV